MTSDELPPESLEGAAKITSGECYSLSESEFDIINIGRTRWRYRSNRSTRERVQYHQNDKFLNCWACRKVPQLYWRRNVLVNLCSSNITGHHSTQCLLAVSAMYGFIYIGINVIWLEHRLNNTVSTKRCLNNNISVKA